MPDPTPPDFLSALVAYWVSQPTLTDAMRGPFFGQAAEDVEPPYCVLSVPVSRVVNRETDGSREVESVYQFEVYDYDQSTAVALGTVVMSLLDPIHTLRPAFDDGYLMAWLWTSGPPPREVPELRSGGARTIWRQTHMYTANTVHPKG